MKRTNQYDLSFDEPITRWDEALPIGNGLMGALIWGNGHPLRFSIDRSDLWDLRPIPQWENNPKYSYDQMREWVSQGRIEDLQQLFEEPYSNPGPTKIPAGALEVLELSENVRVLESRLQLMDAIAQVKFCDGSELEAFVHATEPFGLIRMVGAGDQLRLHCRAPKYASDELPQGKGFTADQSPGELATLGYPAPKIIERDGLQGFIQEGWGGFTYALCIGRQIKPDGWEAAWSVATSNESHDPWALAAARVKGALTLGWDHAAETHAAWWKTYWDQSKVDVPNRSIQRIWYLSTYMLGSVARRFAPPISLQAVWTADDGRIPPWKGDYHHNLNTQLSYWPCYSGNHLEEGLSYIDWLWETRGEALSWTKKFWGKKGFNVPMTSDILGRQIGGWHQHAFSATVGAWLAHHFYLHWRYSQDREFLVTRLYPYITAVAEFLESVTEVNEHGERFLPLSSSPEIFDNRLEAWLPPTSNYDLALIRWTFQAAAEVAREIGEKDEASHWESLLSSLPELSKGQDGRLLVAPDLPLPASHRHFSHLMAIHPLSMITWEEGEEARQTILASLKELDELGTAQWTGYSFAWYATMAARAKDGHRAERALSIFDGAFCSQNGFHVNGDQSGQGYSDYTYRPFTLEGNFAALNSVHEMLLQSYGGVIRVFPAVPSTWQEAAFRKLRAEGGFLVSAKRERGVTQVIEIEATVSGRLGIEQPDDGFDLGQPKVEGEIADLSFEDNLVVMEVSAGAKLTWKRS